MPTETQILYRQWHCDYCHAGGLVEHEAVADAKQIMDEAEYQHSQVSPNCRAPILRVPDESMRAAHK